MKVRKFFIATILGFSLFGCVTSSGPKSILQTEVPGRQRSDYSAEGKNGMVATAHPLASEAAIEIFKKGGNAADAAVAASFAISVLRPQSTGIGGGGFLLFHDAAKSNVQVYDFRERAPKAASKDMYLNKDGEPKDFLYEGKSIPNASVNGHLAVGTPGLVAGLYKFHKDHGKLGWQEVVMPAINLAAKGFPVYKSLAGALEDREEVCSQFPATKAIFYKDGEPLAMGDTLVQRDLANTLALIAEQGAEGFYQGPVAKALLAEMSRGGGLITKADLDTYQVKMRQPVQGTYRGHRIVSMPPPSSGGVHIIQMLNMMANTDYGILGHNTAESVHVMAEIMRRAFADRAKYLGDPDFVPVPTKGLTSPQYAVQLFQTIDFEKASTSAEVGAGNPVPHESPSTTHLSVVDSDGNAVSSTQTVNYSMGSCVVAKDTGVILNNEMDDFSMKPGVPNAYGLVGSEANAIAPEKTMLSSMSPTIVLGPDKKVKMVVGSPGGPRIINATFQTIVNVLDFGMNLEDAVHAHRIHHQWLPDELRIETGGLSPEVIADLKNRGHNVVEKGYIGDVQAIMRQDDSWVGVSDTRSEGQPKGF